MIFRKLTTTDSEQFCNLIIDMYKNLQNLEWFSPMPYDKENIEEMLMSPRFYVLGAFDNDFLCAVCSFDYKCGKLIGKLEFPPNCDTDKLVEIGFTMVHSKYKGQGIMKQMVNYLLMKAKQQGFEWIFGKVNKENLASLKSFFHNGFKTYCNYLKPIKIKDIKTILSGNILNTNAKNLIEAKLVNTHVNDEYIFTDYEIILKKII